MGVGAGLMKGGGSDEVGEGGEMERERKAENIFLFLFFLIVFFIVFLLFFKSYFIWSSVAVFIEIVFFVVVIYCLSCCFYFLDFDIKFFKKKTPKF
jgi:magnesium-transporting ATPase (P-type)